MHRAVLAGFVVATLAVTLAGCNATKREIVVVFRPDATAAMHQAVLQACANAAPHVSAEPIVASTSRVGQESDVRFRVDSADDHDIAQLETCLEKQPGVIGVQDTAATS